MFSARATVLLLSYQLLNFSFSRARQSDHEAVGSGHTIGENINYSVFILFETETIPMPMDTTAVYIVPSPSDSGISSNLLITTSELLSSFPVSSLLTITVTVPPTSSTTSSDVTSTIPVTSVVVGTTGQSSGDGGVIAAIVVSVFIMVAGIAVVVIILAVYIRRKKRSRSYSFTNSLRSTETDRSRVYVNITATAVSQQPCIENGKGGKFSEPPMSPASESSYHIYEMAEITDEEVLGKPQESEEEAQHPGEEPQVVADTSDETSNSVTPRQKHTAHTQRSSSYKQKKPSHRRHAPPRRYNTVGEYEFMMPQLQAAAANAAKKRATMPADMADRPYSEISDDGKSQLNDTYIFMQTEQPTEQFSSFLSKWFDVDKDGDIVEQQNQTDHPLSQASEEDVYITML